jgi:hypothetical protein
MLEWFQSTKTNAIMPGVFVALILAAYATWRDGGFVWVTRWWVWLLVLVTLPLYYFSLGGWHASAGADWLNVRGSFVKIYELTSVEVSTGGGGAYYLDLKDRHGNEVNPQIWMLQQNRELWDLVYNGILHSVHRGHAKTNRRALDRLQLMSPPTAKSR